jgi:hypothetical protein
MTNGFDVRMLLANTTYQIARHVYVRIHILQA